MQSEKYYKNFDNVLTMFELWSKI